MTARAMDTPNGIPQIGLGTYPLKGEDLRATVAMALELGIRHIDTAQMYGNERDVGGAVKSASVPRKDLFIVTKVDPGNLGKARFADSVKKSMDDLGGPADLLLIHWPPADDDLDATVDRLIAEREKGMTRLIGVSNFTPRMLERAQTIAKGALICNQVEFQPLLDQSKLLSAARGQNIVLTAYSPLARGKALQPKVIQDIAARLGRPASEIVLRWIIQQGVVAIPMTTKRANMESNLRALGFTLPDDDMKAITAIGTRQGRTIDPGWMKGRWDD